MLLAGSAWADIDEWTSGGPYGGSVQDLAIDPGAANVVHAATSGGAFKSIHGGINWTLIDSGLSSNVIALSIDPSTPTTVYAGTGGGETRK